MTTTKKRGRPATSHENTEVRKFLAAFIGAFDLIEQYSEVDDILAGVLSLKTAGATSTRAFSRKNLYTILRCCDSITTSATATTLGRDYAQRTVEAYTALARVASKALSSFIASIPAEEHDAMVSVKQQRKAINAPYLEAVARLNATPYSHAFQGGGLHASCMDDEPDAVMADALRIGSPPKCRSLEFAQRGGKAIPVTIPNAMLIENLAGIHALVEAETSPAPKAVLWEGVQAICEAMLSRAPANRRVIAEAA